MGIDCLLAHLLTWEPYPMLSPEGHPICVQPHPSSLGCEILAVTPSTRQGSGIVWQPHCVSWNPHRKVCQQCQLCFRDQACQNSYLVVCILVFPGFPIFPLSLNLWTSIQFSFSEYPQRFIPFPWLEHMRFAGSCFLMLPVVDPGSAALILIENNQTCKANLKPRLQGKGKKKLDVILNLLKKCSNAL